MKINVTFIQHLYTFTKQSGKMYKKNVVLNSFGDIDNIDNNFLKGKS